MGNFSGTVGIDILETQRMFKECSKLSPDWVKGADLSEVLGILLAILKIIKRTHEISLIICATINVICVINLYLFFLMKYSEKMQIIITLGVLVKKLCFFFLQRCILQFIGFNYRYMYKF